MLGKLLALSKTEGDHLDPVIIEQGAAEDTLLGRLDCLRQIAEVRVGWGHWHCSVVP